ncbi:MAG: hypothetical protein IT428_11265 [Planctomycetaceae bacterium]|nr:hypothetical protein [Planctomycetaceae bacterium]
MKKKPTSKPSSSPPKKKATKRKPAKPKRSVSNVVQLAALLLPKDKSLGQEIELAAADPSAYAARFPERMSNRMMDEDEPDLVWLTLVDGLTDRGDLVEFDWKEDPKRVRSEIDRLLKKFVRTGRWSWLADEDEWQGLPTDEFLNQIGDHLRSINLALLCIDIASDSYPVLIRRPEVVEEADRLARESGFGEVFAVDSES